MKRLIAITTLLLAFHGTANATLSLDGSSSNAATSVTLSTTHTSDVIVVIALGTAQTTSISDTAGLSWSAFRSVTTNVGNSSTQTEFYAIAPAALTSDVISSSGGGVSRMIAFGVNGANIITPFDTNVSLPAVGSSASSPFGLTISTTSANTLVFSSLRGSFSLGTVTPPSGSSSVVNAGTTSSVDYQIFSSPLSSTSISYSFSPSATLFVDAIRAAGGAVAVPFSYGFMY